MATVSVAGSSVAPQLESSASQSGTLTAEDRLQGECHRTGAQQHAEQRVSKSAAVDCGRSRGAVIHEFGADCLGMF